MKFSEHSDIALAMSKNQVLYFDYQNHKNTISAHLLRCTGIACTRSVSLSGFCYLTGKQGTYPIKRIKLRPLEQTRVPGSPDQPIDFRWQGYDSIPKLFELGLRMTSGQDHLAVYPWNGCPKYSAPSASHLIHLVHISGFSHQYHVFTKDVRHYYRYQSFDLAMKKLMALARSINR